MASVTINQFGGLYLQPNSMTAAAGKFERLENCVRLYDNIVSSRRGFQEAYRFASGQKINHEFDFQDYIFAVSQNALYRMDVNRASATSASTVNTSSVITITKANHGLTSGDYITQFFVLDTDQAFYNAFQERHATFYGTFQVTVVDASTFRITVGAAATATVTTTAASYQYYVRQPGEAVSVTPGGVIRSHSIASNKNAYFLTDNGTLKLERFDLPILKAGIPQALDLSAILLNFTPPAYSAPLAPNSQVAYRVLFGRRDANMNLILGAPGESITISNQLVDATSVAYSTPTLTITSPAHGLANGRYIEVFGVNGTPVIADGSRYQISNVTTNTFDIAIGAGYSGITTLSYSPFGLAQLMFSIPSEIQSTQYIYQIYRTSPSSSATATPVQDFRLVTEQNITSAEAAEGFVLYIDETPDDIVLGAAELYTNVDTQEGELQANSRPPLAKDFALFKGRVIYANTQAYQALSLAVVAPRLLASGYLLTVNSQVYVFRRNANDNLAVVNELTTSAAVRAGSTVTVTQVQHGFANGDKIYVVETGTLAVTPGLYSITVTSVDTFTFVSAGAAGAGSILYEGRQDSSNRFLIKAFDDTVSANDVTTSEAIDGTARSLIKAINRNPASGIYAQYISGIGDIPGKMYLSAKNLNASAFSITINNANGSDAFFPSIPTSGITVVSDAPAIVNQLMISKFDQPEAVPLTNTILVGSGNRPILRVATLRDSLIVIKEDGVYRLTGDNPSNYTVIPIDVTVICKARNSVVVLNNSVFCLSNQGVVQISDNSAKVVSRDIEPVLSAILVQSGANIDTATSAFSYESDREYVLSTLLPNSNGNISNVVYVFNYLTNAWSRWDTTFNDGDIIGINDSIYYSDTTGDRIFKERKDQKKSDFTGQEFGVPIYLGKVASGAVLTASNLVTVTLAIPHGLLAGEIITVASVNGSLSALFPGGVPDVTGIRTVTSVLTPTTFTYTADSVSTGAIAGVEVDYQDHISELTCTAQATALSVVVLVTTLAPHGLSTGLGITINLSSLTTAFPVSSNITGYRTITVTSPTTFTVNANVAASASQTASVTFTDGLQTNYIVTLKTPAALIPSVGDAVIYNNILYKILEIHNFSSTRYLARLNYSALFQTYQAPFLYSFFEKDIKFSPFTMEDVGKLKYFDVFQAQFRTQGDCSAMDVDFACDTKSTTGVINWVDRVGSDEAQIIFNGFGEIAWGDDPWGEGESIEKDYSTGPAVILRTYVNVDAGTSTFIQPILNHKVAGEELSLQAISFDYDFISTVSTR
jgi:hypothetical protein